jgi:hypothetical protein
MHLLMIPTLQYHLIHKRLLFIVDPFFSQIDEEEPLKQIKQLYNNTHTKAIFGRGSVKVRSNYSW